MKPPPHEDEAAAQTEDDAVVQYVSHTLAPAMWVLDTSALDTTTRLVTKEPH